MKNTCSNVKAADMECCKEMIPIDFESLTIKKEELQDILNESDGANRVYIMAFINDFCRYASREWNATEIDDKIIIEYIKTYNKENYMEMSDSKGNSYLIPESKSITFDYYKGSPLDLDEFGLYKIKDKAIYLDY